MKHIEISRYLSSFGDISHLPRRTLLTEMDKVWRDLKLDNKIPVSLQLNAASKFYSHPVWVLNGIFSQLDKNSLAHRVAIANLINKLDITSVADYGGGSGALARLISEISQVNVDIIEPYPFQFFTEQLDDFHKITIKSVLGSNYDAIIAQDVLEHLDNPLEVALDMVKATRMNGYIVFANCFYPDIHCHLPSTFYLRYTFPFLMTYFGLKYVQRVPGASHALLFQRVRLPKLKTFKAAVRFASLLGPILNQVLGAAAYAKRMLVSP